MATETQFGVNINPLSTPDVVQLSDIIGVDIIRCSISVKDFKTTAKNVDKYLSEGKKISLTINWDYVGRDGQGNKVPVPFPTDLNEYKSKLSPIFKKYGPNKNIIMWTCENEPTTAKFHSGPMSNYLKELKAFVEVATVNKVTETVAGAVHVEIVKMVMNKEMEGGTFEGKATDVKELLDGYKNIPFKYLNFHTSAMGKSYPKDNIVTTAKWALPYTNKKYATSDEWHIEDYTSVDVGEQMLRYIVQQQKEAGYVHSIYISGTGDDIKGILNQWNTHTLTQLGEGYKDEIGTPYEDPDLIRLKEIWPITEEGNNLVAKLNTTVKNDAQSVITAGNALVAEQVTYNLNYELVDLDGIPVLDKNNMPIIVGKALATALVEQTEGNMDNVYDWAIALHKGEPITISHKERNQLIRIIRHAHNMMILLKERLLEKLQEKTVAAEEAESASDEASAEPPTNGRVSTENGQPVPEIINEEYW